MENIKFIINNKKDYIIVMSNTQTFGDLREKINNELFKDKDKLISIHTVIDNPIRGFGLMTLNPGNIPFTFDKIQFERFNLLNKNINITVKLCKKENNKTEKKKKYTQYRSPYLLNKKGNKEVAEFDIDLNSSSDFPPLS